MGYGPHGFCRQALCPLFVRACWSSAPADVDKYSQEDQWPLYQAPRAMQRRPAKTQPQCVGPVDTD